MDRRELALGHGLHECSLSSTSIRFNIYYINFKELMKRAKTDKFWIGNNEMTKKFTDEQKKILGSAYYVSSQTYSTVCRRHILDNFHSYIPKLIIYNIQYPFNKHAK